MRENKLEREEEEKELIKNKKKIDVNRNLTAEELEDEEEQMEEALAESNAEIIVDLIDRQKGSKIKNIDLRRKDNINALPEHELKTQEEVDYALSTYLKTTDGLSLTYRIVDEDNIPKDKLKNKDKTKEYLLSQLLLQLKMKFLSGNLSFDEKMLEESIIKLINLEPIPHEDIVKRNIKIAINIFIDNFKAKLDEIIVAKSAAQNTKAKGTRIINLFFINNPNFKNALSLDEIKDIFKEIFIKRKLINNKSKIFDK